MAFEKHDLVPKMQTERGGDDFTIVAEINVRLRRNGAMSVEGAIGDPALAIGMLENALDAVRRKGDERIVIPANDVGLPR